MLNLKDLVIQAKTDIEQSKNIKELELVRIKYLGKRGHFAKQTIALKHLLPYSRPSIGVLINQAKKDIQQAISKRKVILEACAIETQLIAESLDVSLPGRRIDSGGLHPISYTIKRIEYFFNELGFSTINGPEIEDDYHNFDALNIPVNHPARTEHDTFWFDAKRLLRTQTSSVQIRTMKAQKPPIRIIAPGKVYRNDYDQHHTPMFHQIEGLIIDTNISFSNLKGTLNNFLCNFFEENIRTRFRPSYFPFTEPSAEIDIKMENGNWLEILGCGMIHPNVLHNVNINSEFYSGFAFGIGIERLMMIRYGITDLRVFFENDIRFLKQFK